MATHSDMEAGNTRVIKESFKFLASLVISRGHDYDISNSYYLLNACYVSILQIRQLQLKRISNFSMVTLLVKVEGIFRVLVLSTPPVYLLILKETIFGKEGNEFNVYRF